LQKNNKNPALSRVFCGVDQYCPNCYNMGIDSNKEHKMFLLGLIVGIVVGAYLTIVVIVHTHYFG
jgi:hypothetical protein